MYCAAKPPSGNSPDFPLTPMSKHISRLSLSFCKRCHILKGEVYTRRSSLVPSHGSIGASCVSGATERVCVCVATRPPRATVRTRRAARLPAEAGTPRSPPR